MGWWGNRVHRLHAETPLAERNAWSARAWHGIVAGDRERRLKDGRVALLLHEQGDVLEGIAVVHSVTGAQDMVPVAGQIIRKPYAPAQLLVEIPPLLPPQPPLHRP